MCQLHNISYACGHVDYFLASCEFRFEGLEDANGEFHPCELSTTDVADPSRLCLACSALRGHDSAEQDLIDLNRTEIKSNADDVLSGDGWSTMQINLRNEAYLRKRARNAPFPTSTTISFAYPSASELEVQYCRNEEFLMRRLRRRALQRSFSGGFDEYEVFLEASQEHMLAQGELDNSVLTLRCSSQSPSSPANYERGTQTLNAPTNEASTQTDHLFEKDGELKGAHWRKILPGHPNVQANELDEMANLQNSDTGSRVDSFPYTVQEEVSRTKELNQMFELQVPDVGSLIDCFSSVPQAKAGPINPGHRQNIKSDPRNKGKQAELRSISPKYFGLDGSIEGLHGLHYEENVGLVDGTDDQSENSDLSNYSDDERGVSNPSLEQEEFETLFDDSSLFKGTKGLQKDQDDNSRGLAPLRSQWTDFLSDLRASLGLDTGNGEDEDDDIIASSSHTYEKHDKGKGKAEEEDSQGHSSVPHGLIALASPEGLANLVEMREFLGMSIDSTPRQIYDFVNKCPELIQHCRFGTVPLHSKHESENDADEINLLPDDIEKLEARNAFVQAWTSLHWDFRPNPTREGTAQSSRSDDDRKTTTELRDERSIWSSSSSDSDSTSNNEDTKDDDGDEEMALSIKKNFAKITLEETFPGRLHLPAHKPKIASGLRESWTYYEEDELISAESPSGKIILSHLRRLLCMPESTTARQISLFIDRNATLFRTIHHGVIPSKKSNPLQDPHKDPKSRILAADTEANVHRWKQLATALRRLDWDEIDAQPVLPSIRITVEDMTNSGTSSENEEEDVPLTTSLAVPTRAEIQLARLSPLTAYRAKNPSRLRQSFTR